MLKVINENNYYWFNKLLQGFVVIFLTSVIVFSKDIFSPELVEQKGHTYHVNFVEFLENDFLITAGEDGTIKIWDIQNGLILRSLNQYAAPIKSAALSKDRRFIWAAGLNEKILRFNLRNGEVVQSLESFSNGIFSIGLNNNGQYLAAGGYDGKIKVWNTKFPKRNKESKKFSSSIMSIDFCPQANCLVSINAAGTIELWNYQTGKKIKTLGNHSPKSTNFIDFLSGGKILISAGGDKIKFWNLAGNSIEKTIDTQSATIQSISVSKDEKLLAVGFFDKVIVYEIESGKEIADFQGNSTYFTTLAFNKNNKILAGGTPNGQTYLWDIDRKIKLKILEGEIETIKTSSVNNDFTSFANSTLDNTLSIWKLNQLDFRTNLQNTSLVNVLAFGNEKNIIATGDSEGNAKIWDSEENNSKTINKFEDEVVSLSFSSFEDKIVSADFSGNVIISDFKEQKELCRTKVNVSPKVVFTKDINIIAIGDNKKNLTLFDCRRNLIIDQIKLESPIEGLINFPKEDSLIVGFWNGVVGKFSLKKKEFSIIGKQKSPVTNLELSSDQAALFSGSTKGEIIVWDLTAPRQIKELNGHSSAISSLKSISKDKILMSAGKDNLIIYWDLATGKEILKQISFNENDWLVFTPEGLFDGSPEGVKKILWRFNNNTFEVGTPELYFNDYFYPNLFDEVIAGKKPNPKPGNEISQIDRRQPKVKIISIDGNEHTKEAFNTPHIFYSEKENIQVVLEVTDNNSQKPRTKTNKPSGANDLRLFRNGILVKVWKGNLFKLGIKDKCQQFLSSSNLRTVRCISEIPVESGKNILSAYAFNSADIRSVEDSVSIISAMQKKLGTFYVLSIGVDKYKQEELNLPYSVSGVEKVGKTIFEFQEKMVKKGFNNTEVIKLKDELATKTNILFALNLFSGQTENNPAQYSFLCKLLSEDNCRELKSELSKIKKITPQDAILIHFLGHGQNLNERFFLIPHNFSSENSTSSYFQEAISDLEMKEVLEQIDAKKIVMIIDACRSGQLIGVEKEGRGPMNSKGLAQLAFDKGMLILTASQSSQSALQDKKDSGFEIYNSFLSFTLLEGVEANKADKNKNQELTVREWFNYTAENTPKLIGKVNAKLPLEKRIAYEQNPRIFYRRDFDQNPLIIKEMEVSK